MENRCPQCGAEQPSGEGWGQKLCPVCLMKLGLSGAIPATPLPEPEGSAAKEPWVPIAPESKPLAARPIRALRLGRNWRWAALVTGGAALVALIIIAALHFTERPEPRVIVRLDIDTAIDVELQDFAMSPDGRALAYTADTREGESLLWIRPLDQLESRELRGSEGASMPFWSPDSRWIGFFAGGKLKTIRVDSGPPVTIANVTQPRGGSWSGDGVILFASGADGLRVVPSSGGDVSQVESTESASGFLAYRWPQFLPDGRHFMFSTLSRSVSEVHVGALDSGEKRRLIQNASGGVYSDGRVLFVRSGLLMSQPLDIARWELTHEPVAVAAEPIGPRENRPPPYSAGRDVLAYRTGGPSTTMLLLWMDRVGKVLRTEAEPAEYDGFALSPDSRRVAITQRAPGGDATDLWSLDLARGAAMRLTFDARGAASPLWAPDGRRIAFISRADSGAEIRMIEVNGSVAPAMLLESTEDAVLDSWSPDSRLLLYTTSGKGGRALWILQLEGDRKPTPFLNGDFNYKHGRFSPDGRWVAYVSDESGRDEVYVRSFPSGEVRSLVSVNGGAQPLWRRDTHELLYVSPRRQLTSVAIERDGGRVGTPIPLFQLPPGTDAYAVAGDGQRFLVAAPPDQQHRSPIHVVLGWTHEK